MISKLKMFLDLGSFNYDNLQIYKYNFIMYEEYKNVFSKQCFLFIYVISFNILFLYYIRIQEFYIYEIQTLKFHF